MDRSTHAWLVAALLGIFPAAQALAEDPPASPRARIVKLTVDGPTARPGPSPPRRDPDIRLTGGTTDDEPDRPATALPALGSRVQDPPPLGRPATSPVPPPPAPAPFGPPPSVGPQAGAAQTREIERRLRIDASGRLTLHMDDLDIRRALELLSRQGGLNIMVGPGVSGRVTANLEGVTVEQALGAILKLSNLTARREGTLIYVYSPEEFKLLAYHNQEIETRIYKLNYIRAYDTMGMIQDLLSPDGTMTATPPSREGISESPSFASGGSPSGGGGGGGGATAPSSTGGGGSAGGGGTGGNAMAGGDIVIVRDYKANLKAIDDIIAQIDVMPIQVLVEAVIISVDISKNSELGVNYAVVDNLAQTLGTIGSGTDLVGNSGFTPAKLLTIPIAGATAAANAATAGRLNGGTAEGGFNSSTNGIKFGFVSKNNSGFIRALETLGEIRVLASPRLLVLNKQRAEIQLGQRLGYTTVTQNFTSTVQQVQFLNTGTLLRLRPFVSTDGMVRMEIHPERSSGSTPGGIPQTNTSELTTNVMIPDGATLVIGGLMEDERDYDQEGLPGLNRLPILGAAFGFKSRGIGKRELIVLLTPHIWKQGVEICPPGSPVPGEPLEMQAVSRPGAARSPFDATAGRKPAAPDPRDKAPARVAALTAPAGAMPGSLPASGSRPEAQARRHVVREGEDLWSISKLYYGSGRHFQALWDANRERIGSAESIPVGTPLIIPPLAEPRQTADAEPRDGRAGGRLMATGRASLLKPRPAAPVDPGAVRAGYEAPAPSRGERRRDPADDDYPIHVVGRNETIRTIARDRLGDSRRAGEILALNRDILSNDRPTPGLHLILPKDAAVKGRQGR